MSALSVCEALDLIEPAPLTGIFPGSWINANFDVWIGASEDNRAWEFLLDAREAYAAALQDPAFERFNYPVPPITIGGLTEMVVLRKAIADGTAKPGDLQKAEDFGADILRLCVEVGGVLTGEHGVGVEKRDLMPVMFGTVDLDVQQRVKCAFDPELLLNPGKVFPTLHRCAELGRMHIHAGQLPFPDLPRF